MSLLDIFKAKEKHGAGKVNLLERDCLNIVWFTAGGQRAPMLDSDNNAWAVTNPAKLAGLVKKYADSWMVFEEDLSVETIKKADIQMFIDNLYYRYGCHNIVLDDSKNVINLADMLSVPASHYDRTVPDHEVANPNVRRLILRFNQTIASRFGVSESVQNKLVNEYLKELRGCDVLIPYKKSDEDGKMILYVKGDIRGNLVHYAYTDFEAFPENIRKEGYINGMVQPFDAIMDSAISDNAAIALNVNSAGGGLFIPLCDMKVIKEGGEVKSAEDTPVGGDADSYLAEAIKYHSGRGAQVDMTKAVAFYTKAAELGNAMAQNNLGVVLFRGYDNVAPNYAEAKKWLELAADTIPDAAFMLARNYDLGEKFGQDLGMAAHYYQKAMELGHVDATFNLGVMYLNGEGVPQDQAKAIELIKKAAQMGSPNAIQAMTQLLG